jgi:FkbM family methyltransferase
MTTMGYPKWAMLALPYARWELPGWGKILRALGVYDNGRWDGAPERVVRGKLHGYKMRVSLAAWAERQTYFLGRYYDLPTQLFLTAALRTGETLIDVGGNIGMVSLLGSHLVGPRGRVITFEPNPDPADRIREFIAQNDIRNITLHQLGLADTPGQFTLSVVTDHTGMGTLADPLPEHEALVSRRHTVDVRRGDDVIGPDVTGPTAMKMDIEGFECRALRGLTGTLERLKPAIVTEVMENHLTRAGASARELFDLLQGIGYQSYELGVRRRLLGFGNAVSLTPLKGPRPDHDGDVAWLVPGTVHAERLAPFVRG